MKKTRWSHAALAAAGEATGVCLVALLLDESWQDRFLRLAGNWMLCFLLMFVIISLCDRLKAAEGEHDHET